MSREITISVFRINSTGQRECRTYSLPARCALINVDADNLIGEVWGFVGGDVDNPGEQVDAEFKGLSDGAVFG